jgi:hypothetical protein
MRFFLLPSLQGGVGGGSSLVPLACMFVKLKKCELRCLQRPTSSFTTFLTSSAGDHIKRVTNQTRELFSSLLCSRAMLRRPSVYLTTQPEEGCSSTAFGVPDGGAAAVWEKPANRASAAAPPSGTPAVP